MTLQESFLLLIHFQREEEIEIEVLFRVIEVFVKKRVIVNPKLEENLSCFLKDIFSNISFFYF